VSAADELVANNDRYARGFAKGDLPRAPRRRVAVVACMDARLDPARALGLEEGDAHVIRNAGGLITDDTLRSLAISQRRLGTEEIVLILHTDCGLLSFSDEEFKREIEAETGTQPDWVAETFADVDDGVRESIARVAASPFVPRKDSIRGFVYEVESGRLREVADPAG
jgi:carbonic anhydrase